jgi:MatE
MTTLTSHPSASPGHQAAKVKQMAMLAGPVLPALLKLALPTVVVLVVQTLVGVAETYFVSFLGTEALAGVSLVFPIFMLMQMARFGFAVGARPGRFRNSLRHATASQVPGPSMDYAGLRRSRPFILRPSRMLRPSRAIFVAPAASSSACAT